MGVRARLHAHVCKEPGCSLCPGLDPLGWAFEFPPHLFSIMVTWAMTSESVSSSADATAPPKPFMLSASSTPYSPAEFATNVELDSVTDSVRPAI